MEGAVFVDSDAAGQGWFVDATPGDDAEFRLAQGEMTGVRGEAASRIDLLSVIVHELGHVAGLDHLSSGVMTAQLDAGIRRTPTATLNPLPQASANPAAFDVAALASPPAAPGIDWTTVFNFQGAREIKAVYGLDVVRVPLHRPLLRVHLGARFMPTLADKSECVADVTEQLALRQGRPVLIGTRSVLASEQISAVLTRRGIGHALLNAKQDVTEADVIAAAGQTGRVTVATNMAGRGTDIELGEGVAARGGLHVILTEYHDSRRVDRQLFGRCGRQGDPGSCEAIVSIEDEIFSVCAPGLTAALRRASDRGLRLPQIAFDGLRSLAQWSAERRHAASRTQHHKYDRQLNRMLAFTGAGE